MQVCPLLDSSLPPAVLKSYDRYTHYGLACEVYNKYIALLFVISVSLMFLSKGPENTGIFSSQKKFLLGGDLVASNAKRFLILNLYLKAASERIDII
jgi:hypothetical protein